MITLSAPFFDELEPGMFRLSAPVLDDVVQVDGRKFRESISLAIQKTPTSLSIAREDGRALAVQVSTLADSPTLSEVRRNVFAAPISKLLLERTATDSWILTPTEEVAIAYEAGVMEFLEIICAYGSIKKRQQVSQDVLPLLRSQLEDTLT